MGQPLGAKRLTVDKVIDISDFLLDMGFHYSGSAEDTLRHRDLPVPGRARRIRRALRVQRELAHVAPEL